MRLLVCGGRDFSDKEWLNGVLDGIHQHSPVDILIEGGASGADRLARDWAWNKGIHVATVCAMWVKYGKGAGHRRNEAMMRLDPNMLIAFPGGKGTTNMLDTAYTWKANTWGNAEDLEIINVSQKDASNAS